MEARVQEGRRIGGFGQQEKQDIDQIGQSAVKAADIWEEHTTFQQISKGMADDATNYNTSLQSFAQTLKDPSVDKGDPTLVKSAVDQFKASQEQTAKSFTTEKGRNWYLEHSAAQLDQFQKTVIGQVSQYAGVQALQNNERAVNSSAQLASTDPTQTAHLLDQLQASHTAMAATATVDAETGLRMSEMTKEDGAKIALAGAQGAILGAANKATAAGISDPDTAKVQVHAALDAYMKSDGRLSGLIGEKTNSLSEAADRAGEAAVRDAGRQAVMVQRAKEVKSQDKASAYLAALGTTDLSSPDSLKQANTAILTDPDLLPAAKGSLFSMAERIAKQGTEGPNAAGKDTPATLNGLITRIGAGDKTVTQKTITDLVGAPNGLSTSGAGFLLKQLHPEGGHELEAKQLEAEISLWHAKLATVGLQPGMKDAKGDERFSDALNYYAPIITQNDRAGIARSDTFGPPDAAHPNSIYRQTPIESFAVKAANPVTHTTPPGGTNLLDTVNRLWGQAVAATSGGAEVRTPIDKTPAAPVGSPPPQSIAGAGTPARQAQIKAILAGALAGN